MKKMTLFIAMVGILLIGMLNIGGINDSIEKTAIDSVISVQHMGDSGFSSGLQVAHLIGAYWYLIIAAILLFMIMLEG